MGLRVLMIVSSLSSSPEKLANIVPVKLEHRDMEQRDAVGIRLALALAKQIKTPD